MNSPKDDARMSEICDFLETIEIGGNFQEADLTLLRESALAVQFIYLKYGDEFRAFLEHMSKPLTPDERRKIEEWGISLDDEESENG